MHREEPPGGGGRPLPARSQSLRLRLALRAALLAAVALVGVVFAVDRVLVTPLPTRGDSRLMTLAEGLASLVEDGGAAAFRSDAASWIRADAGEWAALQAPDGRLLFIEGEISGATPVGDGGPGISTEEGIRSGGHRVARRPLAEGGTQGRILVGSPLWEVLEEQRRLRWILVGVAGLGVVLVGLGAWFGAGLVLNPLRAITEAAARPPEEGQATRLPVRDSGDEFDDLARLLNDLLARLAGNLEEERRFASEAAHELRSPLALLRLRAEEAMESRDEDRRRVALESIVADCDRVARLVQALLELSRAGDRPVSDTVHCDAGAVLGDILPDLATLAEARGRRLEGDASTLAGATVAAPPEVIETCVSVLVDNALRYAPEGSLVRVVGGRTGEGRIVVTVADGGPGIPPEEAPRIFDRLFRGTAGRAAGGGFGLGLSLARRLARSCGGELLLQEGGPGGAVFRLELPPGPGEAPQG